MERECDACVSSPTSKVILAAHIERSHRDSEFTCRDRGTIVILWALACALRNVEQNRYRSGELLWTQPVDKRFSRSLSTLRSPSRTHEPNNISMGTLWPE